MQHAFCSQMCFPVFTVFQHLSSVCLLVFSQYDSDISAYTVERTLDMEKRSALLRELSRNKKRRGTVRRSCRTLCFSAVVRHSTDLFEYIADIFSWFVAWQLKNFSLLYMYVICELVWVLWIFHDYPLLYPGVIFVFCLQELCAVKTWMIHRRLTQIIVCFQSN